MRAGRSSGWVAPQRSSFRQGYPEKGYEAFVHVVRLDRVKMSIIAAPRGGVNLDRAKPRYTVTMSTSSAREARVVGIALGPGSVDGPHENFVHMWQGDSDDREDRTCDRCVLKLVWGIIGCCIRRSLVSRRLEATASLENRHRDGTGPGHDVGPNL